jgi:very-short-patch-repair endonuclease
VTFYRTNPPCPPFSRNGKRGDKYFYFHLRWNRPIYFEYEGRERFFVADFYCAKKRLIIEIDGSIHKNQHEYDVLRTAILNKNRYTVIRFDNDELTDQNSVLKKLLTHLNPKTIGPPFLL